MAVKRKYSKKAWNEFQNKLAKYVSPDQPIDFVYAVRDMMARAASTNGLNDSYVREIGKKYFISEVNQKRLLELKQKWDKFSKEYGKVKTEYADVSKLTDDSVFALSKEEKKKYKKWKEMGEVNDANDVIKDELAKQLKVISQGKIEGLGEFQKNTREALGAKVGKKALKKERDEAAFVSVLNGYTKIPDQIKDLLKNNNRVNKDNVKTIVTTYQNLAKIPHPKKSELETEFRQIAAKSKVKLSKFEFETMWNVQQQRLANNARAMIETVKIDNQPKDDAKNKDYRILRAGLREMREILKKEKKNKMFGDLGDDNLNKIKHLYNAVDAMRRLDAPHLKALFNTRTTKKAKRLRNKVEEKMKRRLDEAERRELMTDARIKLMRSASAEVLAQPNASLAPNNVVRPLGAGYRDEKIENITDLVSKLASKLANTAYDTKQAEKYEKLQQKITKLQNEFNNWKIDHAGTANDWRNKASGTSFEWFVFEERYKGLSSQLNNLNLRYGYEAEIVTQETSPPADSDTLTSEAEKSKESASWSVSSNSSSKSSAPAMSGEGGSEPSAVNVNDAERKQILNEINNYVHIINVYLMNDAFDENLTQQVRKDAEEFVNGVKEWVKEWQEKNKDAPLSMIQESKANIEEHFKKVNGAIQSSAAPVSAENKASDAAPADNKKISKKEREHIFGNLRNRIHFLDVSIQYENLSPTLNDRVKAFQKQVNEWVDANQNEYDSSKLEKGYKELDRQYKELNNEINARDNAIASFKTASEKLMQEVKNKYEELKKELSPQELLTNTDAKLAYNQVQIADAFYNDMLKEIDQNTTPEMLEQKLKDFEQKCNSAVTNIGNFQKNIKNVKSLFDMLEGTKKQTVQAINPKQESRDKFVTGYSKALDSIDDKIKDLENKIDLSVSVNVKEYDEKIVPLKKWLVEEREYLQKIQSNLSDAVTTELGNRRVQVYPGKLNEVEEVARKLTPSAIRSEPSMPVKEKEAVVAQPQQPQAMEAPAADKERNKPAVVFRPLNSNVGVPITSDNVTSEGLSEKKLTDKIIVLLQRVLNRNAPDERKEFKDIIGKMLGELKDAAKLSGEEQMKKYAELEQKIDNHQKELDKRPLQQSDVTELSSPPPTKK